MERYRARVQIELKAKNMKTQNYEIGPKMHLNQAFESALKAARAAKAKTFITFNGVRFFVYPNTTFAEAINAYMDAQKKTYAIQKLLKQKIKQNEK